MRRFGLLGVAHGVEQLELEPFRVETVEKEDVACAVTEPVATSLRNTRLYYAARLVPKHAHSVQQRFALMRTQMQLIYYPMWRLVYEHDGEELEAAIDGVRGHVVRAAVVRRERDHLVDWLAAAGGVGFLTRNE